MRISIQSNYVGNATTATALATPRAIAGTDFSGIAPIEIGRMVTTEVIQPASDTLAAAECYNTLINNYGQSQANTQTLPAAAAGLSFVAIIGTSGMGAFNVKAGAGDKIYLGGTALDDGDKAALATPAVGNCARFYCFKTGAAAYDWYCDPIVGTWTDGGV